MKRRRQLIVAAATLAGCTGIAAWNGGWPGRVDAAAHNAGVVNAAVTSAAAAVAAPAGAGTLKHAALEQEMARITRGLDGVVGACAMDAAGVACVNGDRTFSLQSVMKLLAGIAVLDAVDHKGWKLDDAIVVKPEDLSLAVQPIKKLVTPEGYRTTIGDLVRRAIVDSDSAAVDILVARLGGPPAVQATLDRLGVKNVRVDRDERHLQTEISGLTWRQEFVDEARLAQALAKVPESKRAEAYRAYQSDPRDRATPKGMAALLHDLGAGKLVSPSSTKFLMDVMVETVTFPDRLKAGLSGGWTLGHKTGSSSTWRGVTEATNDVGILTAPDGTRIAIVVFIGNSRAPNPAKAAAMADISRATIASFQ